MELITGTISLARQLEAAEARNAAAFVAAHGEVLEAGGGVAAFAGPGSPLTHWIGAGMGGPVSEADADRVEAFYSERESPVNVELCPLADPGLFEILARRGYRIVEFNNVLIRPVALPLDAREVAVARTDDIEMWSRTLAAGFFEHEPGPAEIEIGHRLMTIPEAEAYIAFAEDHAAAAAALIVDQTLATLCADATLPAWRGRGLQSALIRARLARAASAGATLATASTVPGSVSQRNYERHGFRVVYTKLNFQRDNR